MVQKKYIIQFIRNISMTFVIVLGLITFQGAGCGGSKIIKGPGENKKDKSTGVCNIDYDIYPGCNESNEACAMAIRINTDRKNHPEESDCAPAIKWNAALAAVATAHSQNMCRHRTLTHKLEGKDPFDRLTDAGINFVAAGENVTNGTDGVYALDDLEDGLMEEPECKSNHRGNILNRDFTHVGIGVVHCDDGNLYITQDFATFSFDDLRDDPHEYCK